jgi:hypothetical protein
MGIGSRPISGTHFAYAVLDKSRIAGASVDAARLSETGSVIDNRSSDEELGYAGRRQL